MAGYLAKNIYGVQDRGMGRTTEDGSLKGGRVYWYGPALTEEEELERDKKAREASEGEDWSPEDIFNKVNEVIKDQGKGHTKSEVGALFKKLTASLDDDEDGKGFGTSKGDMEVMTNLFTILKGLKGFV